MFPQDESLDSLSQGHEGTVNRKEVVGDPALVFWACTRQGLACSEHPGISGWIKEKLRSVTQRTDYASVHDPWSQTVVQ